MIKTYLKHLVLEKFINTVFDGFIDVFHKPRNFYTKNDFYIDQKVNTLDFGLYEYRYNNAHIIEMRRNTVIRIKFESANIFKYGQLYKTHHWCYHEFPICSVDDFT